jgi:hypothetical protein
VHRKRLGGWAVYGGTEENADRAMADSAKVVKAGAGAAVATFPPVQSLSQDQKHRQHLPLECLMFLNSNEVAEKVPPTRAPEH